MYDLFKIGAKIVNFSHMRKRGQVRGIIKVRVSTC